MIRLMDLLGNPQNKLKVIHVAGTSGKTSTCYFVASMLTQQGFKTGLTISPHIDNINERAQIDLFPLKESRYCRLLNEFMGMIEKLDIQPSYFELLIAFAYWVFFKEKVDYAVIEVGLGGLLDGTNVISSRDKLCIITDIGLDHVEILGNTLESITAQKAGIILPGNDVFMNSQSKKVMKVVSDQCRKIGAILYVRNKPCTVISKSKLPSFQKRNALLAYAVTSHILKNNGISSINNAKLQQALEVYIPARMEVVTYKGKVLILDGSHNEQKVEALVKEVQKEYSNRSISLLLSFGRNKESSIADSLKQFHKISDEVIVTNFKLAQDEIRTSINLVQLAAASKSTGFKKVKIEPDPKQAFKELQKSKAEIIIISGSYYLLNHIRPVIFTDGDKH